MKLFLISDTHFGVRTNSVEWMEIQRSFFFDWFFQDVKKRLSPGDEIFHLGDVFDSRQSINLKVLNLGMDVFEEMSKIAPVKVILGNHDCHDLNSNDINSAKPLKWIPGVTVYQEPEIIEVGGKKILLMPWRANNEKERECLRQFGEADYLFCHTDVKGAEFNKWSKVDHGNDISEFSSYSKVYCGHIHYRQKVGNVNFVGCPYPMSRSDMDNKKGYWVLDLESGTEEFIENRVSPDFIRLSLTEALGMTLGDLKSKIRNNFVDIYIDESDAIDFPFQEFEELLEGHSRKLTFKTNQSTQSISLVDNESGGESDLDLMNLSERFITGLNYDDRIKTRLSEYVKQLYNRAIEGRQAVS